MSTISILNYPGRTKNTAAKVLSVISVRMTGMRMLFFGMKTQFRNLLMIELNYWKKPNCM